MNGGYILVDCEGLDLIKGSTPQTITGLYALVKEAMSLNKPIFAVNCNWGGKPVTPIQAFAIDWGDTGIIVTSSTLQIIISSESVVTINNMVE